MNDINMNALNKISEGELTDTKKILMDKARELLPLIRSNAEKTDRERRTAEENIQAMQAAGLFKMMVPKRYGGHEVDFRTNMEVVSIVAEACGGTSWVLNLISVCAWFTALFPALAQDDVFGADNDARVAGVFMPSGTLTRVAGGIRVSGKWYYSSGCLHANWGLLGLMELDAEGNPVDQYLGLVPMDELEIEDTWYTTGMRGSGSNCLVAKDVFIPEHRMLSLSKAIAGDYSTEFKDEAVYRSAFIPVASLVIAVPQLGLARAALKYVIDKSQNRPISYTFVKKQADSVGFQLQVAEAAMKIETAYLHACRAADDIDNWAKSDHYMDYLTRARVKADSSELARHVHDAMEILMTAHGAASFAESSPMQRLWRDSSTASRHGAVLSALSNECYGKALLGVANDLTPLV